MQSIYPSPKYFFSGLCLALWSFTTLSHAVDSNGSERPPNVVVILADDFGFDDLGTNNKIVVTPNLDRLASKSVQFDNFYVNAQCAPTRAAFLTGRQFFLTGVWGVHGGRDYINLRETLLPEVFAENGYVTGMMGKWHSGKSDGYFPWDRGFDEAHLARLYKFTPEMGSAVAVNGVVEPVDGWAEKEYTDRALDFIEQHKDEPFFLYVPYMSTHSFWRAPEVLIQKQRDLGHPEGLAVFLAMAEYMDEQIGRILEKIKALGLADDTIVVFFSDNGPIGSGGPHHDGSGPMYTRGKDWSKRNPHGLRGGKGSMYENGIKSVLYIRSPEYPEDQGSRITEVTNVADLYPTLIEMAGLKLPNDQLPLSGQSLLPLLEGKGGASNWNTRSHFFASPAPNGTIGSYTSGGPVEHPAIDKQRDTEIFAFDNINVALRKGDYKYVQMKNEAGLYNVAKDPRERKAIKDQPKLENSMREELKRWWQSILDDPYTFEKPLQQISASRADESIIYLTAARTTLGNTEMAAHFAYGFREKGDAVVLPVRVVEAGDYEVLIHYSAKKATNAVFEFRIGDVSREFIIDRAIAERRQSGLFEFYPDDCISLGTIHLKASDENEQLSVRLLEHSGKRDAIDTLAYVVFRKINS